MGSTFLSLHYHIVFSTKEREPLIGDDWRDDLHAYLGGTVRGLGGVTVAIGGVADHVHLLIGLRATQTLSDFMRELKKSSSVWAAERVGRGFGWQDGYAAFTVSASHVERVKRYIANQAEHHCKISFADELREFLERSDMDYDPEYLL